MRTGKKSVFLLSVGIALAIIIVVNLIGENVFHRFDLTDDQRHTVSDASAELLESLPNQVFVTVYYGGDLPTHYKEYEIGMRTFLQALTLKSDGKLDYQFINPIEDPSLYRSFGEKGMYAFPISAPVTYGSSKETQVLPYAQVSYNRREVMMNLIHNCTFTNESQQPDFSVECAMQRFEYNLMTTIYNLSREKYKTIGLLTGHGEYPREAMSDLYADIDNFYNFVQVDLSKGKAIGPSNLDLLMVMQPDTILSEREKYELDQYIMRGGQVIFLMDQERLDFSIGEQAATLSFLRTTHLDDLFMKYGLKLNYNLIKDANCGMISTTSFTAAFGNETRKSYWPFFPVIRNISGHPATRQLSRLLIRYGSTIDTFHIDGLQKTVLFKTSGRTWKKEGRQYININQELQVKPDMSKYVDGGQIMGVLLEGQLPSLFANRAAPRDSAAPQAPNEAFLAQSAPDASPRVILISDGEFATGDRAGGKVGRLPEENKTAMMNLIDYMTGQEIMTKLRVRTYNGRMLAPEKVIGNETSIRIINLGLPLLGIVFFGVGRWYLRRRKNMALRQSA
jgi:ABC-2 type transport system permease protein